MMICFFSNQIHNLTKTQFTSCFFFKNLFRGKFLGKGGFAKCYEFKRDDTGEVMAGKVVPKALLAKSHQKVSKLSIKKRLC